MKKVFLSAIMMIAFVGTSMANDIAEKENCISENVVQTDCSKVAAYKLEQYEETHGCLTNTQAKFKYDQFFNDCQKGCDDASNGGTNNQPHKLTNSN